MNVESKRNSKIETPAGRLGDTILHPLSCDLSRELLYLAGDEAFASKSMKAVHGCHVINLEAHAERLWPLQEMERTGGEPDVVRQDKGTGE